MKTDKKSGRYDNYESWEKEWLIDRIKQLENEVCLIRDDSKYDLVTELAKMQLECEKAENLVLVVYKFTIPFGKMFRFFA